MTTRPIVSVIIEDNNNTMQIIERYIGKSGVEYIFEYTDMDSFESLNPAECKQVYGVCFYGDEMVVGFGGKKQAWGIIGGTVEAGETFEQTLAREIQEESNMEVIASIPIGAQKMIDTRDGSFVRQLRYACLVRPYGPFVSDPADSVTEIKLIKPTDYKTYFDWGKIGERIIERALELRSKFLA